MYAKEDHMSPLVLVGIAGAAELVAGGGVELAAGVVHGANAWTAEAGVRQVEGDLRVIEGGFEAALQLDARIGIAPVFVASIVPEELGLAGDLGPVWLRGGIAPAPWRVEAVDGWDTTLVTWSVEDRRALPGSFLAAEIGIGDRDKGVAFLGGLDLGTGLELLGDVGGQLTRAPLLTGVHGRVGGQGVKLGGGIFAWPDSPAVVAQGGATFEFDDLTLEAQAVGGWNATFGAHVQGALFPKGVATPVARVEILGAQPGGAVGVQVKPTGWLFLKAEVAYAEGAPQGWVEVAMFGETRTGAKKKR